MEPGTDTAWRPEMGRHEAFATPPPTGVPGRHPLSCLPRTGSLGASAPSCERETEPGHGEEAENVRWAQLQITKLA